MQATLAGPRKGLTNAGIVISDPLLATAGNLKFPAGPPTCGAGLPGDCGAGRAALARRIAISATTGGRMAPDGILTLPAFSLSPSLGPHLPQARSRLPLSDRADHPSSSPSSSIPVTTPGS